MLHGMYIIKTDILIWKNQPYVILVFLNIRSLTYLLTYLHTYSMVQSPS